MSIEIKTPAVHHIALKVSNLECSRDFYLKTLGFPAVMEFPDLFLFSAGTTVVGISRAREAGAFNPHRVGLNHIALACTDDAELERVAQALSNAGVENTGVKLDETLGKRYVAFKDPDRIAWEFFHV